MFCDNFNESAITRNDGQKLKNILKLNKNACVFYICSKTYKASAVTPSPTKRMNNHSA